MPIRPPRPGPPPRTLARRRPAGWPEGRNPARDRRSPAREVPGRPGRGFSPARCTAPPPRGGGGESRESLRVGLGFGHGGRTCQWRRGPSDLNFRLARAGAGRTQVGAREWFAVPTRRRRPPPRPGPSCWAWGKGKMAGPVRAGYGEAAGPAAGPAATGWPRRTARVRLRSGGDAPADLLRGPTHGPAWRAAAALPVVPSDSDVVGLLPCRRAGYGVGGVAGAQDRRAGRA